MQDFSHILKPYGIDFPLTSDDSIEIMMTEGIVFVQIESRDTGIQQFRKAFDQQEGFVDFEGVNLNKVHKEALLVKLRKRGMSHSQMQRLTGIPQNHINTILSQRRNVNA